MWRLAESLKHLRAQVNELWPERDKTSDGAIGDEAHASRTSDHNPWVKDSAGVGVVTAIDIDADLSGTENVGKLVFMLQMSRDPRIKYIIWNRQITLSEDITRWKPYHGINAHQHHAHISVKPEVRLYDDATDWSLGKSAVEITPEPKPPAGRDLLIGMYGDDVRALQTALRIKADGKFGSLTEKAVKDFQLEHGLRVDGTVGKSTRAALGI